MQDHVHQTTARPAVAAPDTRDPTMTDNRPLNENRIVLAVAAAALALMAGLIALFWQPAPPKTVVMSTGPADGAYHAYGQQYRQILARSGIELVLLTSAGAEENIARLRGRKDKVVLALLQGGATPPPEHQEGIESLGTVAFEAVWVFHRAGLALDRLSGLSGRRVAVGVPGSGTLTLARELLGQNQVAGPGTELLETGGKAAAQALLAGEIDAAIFVATPEAPAVQQLLAAPGIALFSFRRAEAYARRYPFLGALDLPEGAFDLGRNLPPADVRLVAARASVVAAAELHPVIADLMLDAMREVHGGGGMLWRAGTFPAAEAPSYPLSSDAAAFYKTGPSGLRRYVPFWAVAWLQRLIFFGLPVLVIGLPLMRFLPSLYRWTVRRRIYRWYGELAVIERALAQGQGDPDLHFRKLERIEARVKHLRVPPAFGGEAAMLRMHLELVRARLGGAGSGVAPPSSPR